MRYFDSLCAALAQTSMRKTMQQKDKRYTCLLGQSGLGWVGVDFGHEVGTKLVQSWYEVGPKCSNSMHAFMHTAQMLGYPRAGYEPEHVSFR
jgi:predicted DNA-binding WGR domain protein